MAATYRPIQWNKHKRVYDAVLICGIALYLTVFTIVGMTTPDSANTSIEISLIRALGGCAFVMLHIVLAIGPLSRLSPKFIPLLYNRRHLGVTMFLLALSHALFALIWYHGFGVIHPIVSLFVSNPRYDEIGNFPFESLGAFALTILFVLAATSHDFWLNNLSPVVWKSLHMLIYPAYAALVLHVVLGTAAYNTQTPLQFWAVITGFITLAGLHISVAIVQFGRDRGSKAAAIAGWIQVGPAREIPDRRARIITTPNGTQIAVFRHGNKVSAISNRCAHQMGPLGEGCIVDGLVTCPWHGWQYDPETGRSPPPYTEKVATFPVRIDKGRVLVHVTPNAKGTPAVPAQIG